MDKETFIKLKRIYDQADSFTKELIEKEFPKIKENKNERSGWKSFNNVPISSMLAWLENPKSFEWNEDVITIDSCEYINEPYGIGNCEFCAERRKKEQEELIYKIKEQ